MDVTDEAAVGLAREGADPAVLDRLAALGADPAQVRRWADWHSGQAPVDAGCYAAGLWALLEAGCRPQDAQAAAAGAAWAGCPARALAAWWVAGLLPEGADASEVFAVLSPWAEPCPEPLLEDWMPEAASWAAAGVPPQQAFAAWTDPQPAWAYPDLDADPGPGAVPGQEAPRRGATVGQQALL